MLQSNEKIIKHKVGLLNLAEELGNVSKACQIMGLSRDTFYRYRDAVEDGGVEALLRWTSPEFGSVSPGEFIPVAEESGLIGELGEWVLRTACAQLQRWRAAHPDLHIAVNVSSHQVRKPGLSQIVEGALRDSGLDPAHLELEITESALLGNEECVVSTLNDLKDMGVRLALDDFGTGYSSLTQIHALPLTKIKIDRSFVCGIDKSPASYKIVKSLLSLSHDMGLGCVIEGVETKAEMQTLERLGARLIQGFHFSRPVPEADIAALLGGRTMESVAG